MKKLTLALVAVIALMALQARASSPATPLPVFVSILPQKYVVERLGGDQIAVSVMVGPGQSPETFEPSARQIAKLSQAQLYFSIGVSIEDSWLKRARAVNPSLRVVAMDRGVSRLPLVGTNHEPNGPDPHIWTSPQRMKVMAATVRDALIEKTPTQQGFYESNYRAVSTELDVLDRELQSILKNAKGKSFLVFHPAWSYLANDYGLRQISIETQGKEPGARSLAHVIEVAQRENAKTIFVQAQFSRRTADTVAAAIGARIVALDPLAEDYPNNLLHVARELADALQ